MNKMKQFIMVLMVAVGAAFTTGCNRIEPGYVGIAVNQAGSNKGVEDYPLLTGWAYYNPITTKILKNEVALCTVLYSVSTLSYPKL